MALLTAKSSKNSSSMQKKQGGRTKAYGRLSDSAKTHLQQLILSINMLADISFSDILVLAPASSGTNCDFSVLGHARPINSSTIHYEDMVGSTFSTKMRPFLNRAFLSGEICEGGIFLPELNHWIQTMAIPICCEGEIIGAMVKESSPAVSPAVGGAQDTGQLETAFSSAFDRLAEMVADGTYEFARGLIEHDHPPRVGDGLMLLDSESNAEYISPNAYSALRRIGIIQDPTNKKISDIAVLEISEKTQLPQTDEVEANDCSVVIQCLPLLARGECTGTLILLRDITELRRRDRLLLTKDATIAEIHHRVKNNLQTISSLLQLQSRRLSVPESRFAILESARRIRSIAIVHDILSHEAKGQVRYEEIVKSLATEISEALISPEIPIQLEIEGAAGFISSENASTLALIMSELLQNAIDHAFSDGREKMPKISVAFSRSEKMLDIDISDNGKGMPDGFSLDHSPGLGLTIVRTLMEADLRGAINITSLKRGTSIKLSIPLPKEGSKESDGGSIQNI